MTASTSPPPASRSGGFAVVDEVRVDPARGLVHEHGWQSWSPTATYAVAITSPRPGNEREHLMEFRPETPAPPDGFQGEGILAVRSAPGEPVQVYGTPDPRHRVPSIRAALRGDRLIISADGPVTTREHGGDIEPALAALGDDVAQTLAVEPLRAAPTVWCSWYHYFLDVTEADVLENLAAIRAADLPVDVVQIDDGWQAGIGDWTKLSGRFSSLRNLTEAIGAEGRRAGIWIAPFFAGSDSELVRDHPDWVVGPAGDNWGETLYGLDLTHPEVRVWLADVFGRLRDDGFEYFKLDFMYAGALAGRRREDVTAVEAYRSGLELIRAAVGPDAYLLGCGAPILPSVGLVDGMRVGPDTFGTDIADVLDGPLPGEACSRARRWQHGRFWVNDADCLVARPAFARRAAWAEVVEQCSGLRSASDRVADLDEWGLATTRKILGTVPPPTPFVDDHVGGGGPP